MFKGARMLIKRFLLNGIQLLIATYKIASSASTDIDEGIFHRRPLMKADTTPE